MPSKNKTISFRVPEDQFELYKEVADALDCDVSALVRETMGAVLGVYEEHGEDDFAGVLPDSGSGPEDLGNELESYLADLVDFYSSSGLPMEAKKGSIGNHIDLMKGDEAYREFHVSVQGGEYNSLRGLLEGREGAGGFEEVLESQVEDDEDAHEEIVGMFGGVLNYVQKGEVEDAWGAVEDAREEGYREAATVMGGFIYGFDD